MCEVEGGNRIGGRINTSEFGGDRIDMGATWIHGIGGNPVYKIAQDINSFCMDGPLEIDAVTIAEDGCVLNPSLVDPISNLFNKLMDFAQGKLLIEDGVVKSSNLKSIGSFLRRGLDAYWDSDIHQLKGLDKWRKRSLEQGIFAIFENIQRTYTSTSDLQMLDFSAEKEYACFLEKK